MRGTIPAEIRASGEPVSARLRIFRCAGRVLLYMGRNHLQIKSLAADLEAIRAADVSGVSSQIEGEGSRGLD